MDGLPSKFKHISKFFFGVSMRVKFSYFHNLFIGQFGLGVLHTLWLVHSAMFPFIKMISRTGVPSQIIQGNMGADTILVAAFHSWRTWTNKGGKHELVNPNSVILTQRHTRVAFTQCLVEYAAGWRLYSTLIANFISRKPRYRFPFFKRYAKLISSHGRASSKVGLWLEPLRCPNTAAAYFL